MENIRQYSDSGILHYYLKVEKIPHSDLYNPVSFEQWKMLRELEPSKFIVPYSTYVEMKNDEYLNEIERRKNCSLELKNFRYYLSGENSIDKPQKELIRKIENNPLFDYWVDKNHKNWVLNYEIKNN